MEAIDINMGQDEKAAQNKVDSLNAIRAVLAAEAFSQSYLQCSQNVPGKHTDGLAYYEMIDEDFVVKADPLVRKCCGSLGEIVPLDCEGCDDYPLRHCQWNDYANSTWICEDNLTWAECFDKCGYWTQGLSCGKHRGTGWSNASFTTNHFYEPCVGS
jgi:hypothetical protein